MMDKDIQNLRKILIHEYKRPDLADLLIGCKSRLDESSQYGSYWFSTLSTFEIHTPINKRT
jgi:hypothetical protein